jgi:hypothetical protein
MNYQDHYNRLIDRAKTRSTPTGYTETHHILPRCLGGSDDKDNLVQLTPEEHYVAHQLLIKIHPTNDSLVYAANMMTVGENRQTNKRYGWLKKKYQSVCKKRVGEKNGSYGRSWYHNPDTLDSGKFLSCAVPDGWVKGRTPKISLCCVCGKSTGKRHAKWCDEHRGKQKTRVIRQTKAKSEYSHEEKREALINSKGNIRKALYSLGLNDSGSHYKVMREIKKTL